MAPVLAGTPTAGPVHFSGCFKTRMSYHAERRKVQRASARNGTDRAQLRGQVVQLIGQRVCDC